MESRSSDPGVGYSRVGAGGDLSDCVGVAGGLVTMWAAWEPVEYVGEEVAVVAFFSWGR